MANKCLKENDDPYMLFSGRCTPFSPGAASSTLSLVRCVGAPRCVYSKQLGVSTLPDAVVSTPHLAVPELLVTWKLMVKV